MKRICAASIVAVLVGGVCAPRAVAAEKYSTALVAAAMRAAEPKIAIDSRTRPPTVYVTAPDDSTALLWRSTDGGRTFKRMAPSGGLSGDADVAVDDRGTVYVADLFDAKGRATLPVSTSTNGGRSYARVVSVAPDHPSLDRQWLATNRAGHVLATATYFGSLLAWVSNDSARRFRGPVTVATGIRLQGPIVVGPRRVYYTIYGDESGLHSAKSPDGVHWTIDDIANNRTSVLFPVIAVDASSNLYAVWSEAEGQTFTGPVFLATSSNGGVTWSDPVPVSATTPDVFGTVPSAVFPWVVAGARGRVAVSYALARQVAGPDLGADYGGPQTQWDLVVASTTNALSAKPRWRRTVVAPDFHTGSICSVGTGCFGPQQAGLLNAPTPQDRRHLDFDGAAVDRLGNVYVAFNRDRSPATGDPNDVVRSRTDIMVVRQTGGTRLR